MFATVRYHDARSHGIGTQCVSPARQDPLGRRIMLSILDRFDVGLLRSRKNGSRRARLGIWVVVTCRFGLIRFRWSGSMTCRRPQPPFALELFWQLEFGQFVPHPERINSYAAAVGRTVRSHLQQMMG